VTEFFVPVPSVTVRQAIQRSREQEMRQPRHEQDRASAIPQVLQDLWQEVQRASQALALPGARPGMDYRPLTYAELYGRLLHARRHTVLRIDELLPVKVSAHQSEVDSCGPGELERAVRN
jgi:hypothetical protein